MFQRISSPRGLFSRAEDKLKLSDDEIEQAFTRSETIVERYFTPSAVLSCVLPGRITESSSTNVVSFSSVRTTNALLRRRMNLQSRVFAVTIHDCNTALTPTGFAPNRTPQGRHRIVLTGRTTRSSRNALAIEIRVSYATTNCLSC